MIVDCLSSLECRSAGRYPVSMPRPHIPATTNCRNTHLVDLPIRSGGFTTTGLLYNLQYKLVNTCLVTLCVARNILRRVKMWETIPTTQHKKAHSLVGFCVLVKDHFCQNNAVFGIPQLFYCAELPPKPLSLYSSGAINHTRSVSSSYVLASVTSPRASHSATHTFSSWSW